MDARNLKTVEDLLLSPEESAELVGGEIVRRPMTRAAHARTQSRASRQLGPFDDPQGSGGWWILTEASVAYEAHECPSHDLAGWRRDRLPKLPEGIIDLPPDWVCEIVSPGHEKKDTLLMPLLLRRHKVPYYWLIWPEDRVLIAHALDGDNFRIVATLKDQAKARIPPFDAIELDLGYILGME